MKRCLGCQCCFESEKWDCPQCGRRPDARNGVLCFIENAAVTGNGFKPEYFAKLATVEEHNFWFCARNRLIQSLGNYFPDAANFSERLWNWIRPSWRARDLTANTVGRKRDF
jgi:hypothetical protein